MKPAKYMEEEKLIHKAIKALVQDLGPTETARFLNLRRARRLDSVRRHRQWQAHLDKDKFFDEIFGAEKGVERRDRSGEHRDQS